MKFLLPFVILLIGCFQYTWNDPTPVENPPVPPAIIARGTSGMVDWQCHLSELNHELAWVQCDFQNKLHMAVGPACLRISFYDNATSKLVIESRTVCSGILPALETSTRYAAFQKENRVALRKCGENLGLCVMLAAGAP